MKWKCINCFKTWPEDIEDDGDYSHGLCRECARKILKTKINKKQKDEGNFPCFGTADTFCDQDQCKYRDLCLNKKI